MNKKEPKVTVVEHETHTETITNYGIYDRRVIQQKPGKTYFVPLVGGTFESYLESIEKEINDALAEDGRPEDSFARQAEFELRELRAAIEAGDVVEAARFGISLGEWLEMMRIEPFESLVRNGNGGPGRNAILKDRDLIALIKSEVRKECKEGHSFSRACNSVAERMSDTERTFSGKTVERCFTDDEKKRLTR